MNPKIVSVSGEITGSGGASHVNMKPRIAIVGAGAFGKNHLRAVDQIARQSQTAILAGVHDIDSARAADVAAPFGCTVFSSLDQLASQADAAIIVTPTTAHAEIGCKLMNAGLHVLVEKPIADTVANGRALVETAEKTGRVLQVGHLERFNPAVIALGPVITTPLFFEIHRMSEFSPRSLDVDVVLDLMVHDLDIVLSLTGEMPDEIRAAGICILSRKVDIANVRLEFPSGCIANLTASRVSTERVRKMRLFQPHEYISLDYQKQEVMRIRVKAPSPSAAMPAIDFAPLTVTKDEPLRLEIEGFVEAIKQGTAPRVTGQQALAALEVAWTILDRIEVHSKLVSKTLDSASGAKYVGESTAGPGGWRV